MVAGEALIDLVTIDGERYAAHVGGSPLNVAVGAARLGLHTELMTRIGRGPLGERIARYLTENQVGDRLVRRVDLPSSLALVTLDRQADAAYDFYLDGTADTGWQVLPPIGEVDMLHLGSLAMQRDPALFEQLAAGARQAGALVSYDPNIRRMPARPGAACARESEVARVERQVALADVVKASTEDLRALYPQADLSQTDVSRAAVSQIARGWLATGPSIVVVTGGADGAAAFTRDVHLDRRAIAGPVVDTVGAGDAATAGLLCALAERGLLTRGAIGRVTRPELTDIIDFALACAAITVSRPGAAPPTRGEIVDSL